jgi:hypothetical protein
MNNSWPGLIIMVLKEWEHLTQMDALRFDLNNSAQKGDGLK